MEWMNVIQTLGFPIAVAVALGVFIYIKDQRVADEAKEREDKLLNANTKSAEALDKVADTINDSNAINKELSETNRMLVSKIDNQLTKIDSIDGNVNKILNKLNN